MRYLMIYFFLLTLCFGSLRSDINSDGRVDFQDFSILASEWLMEESMSDFALKFNGTDQYVTVADNDALDFGEGDFSIAFWVYGSTSGKNVVILHKYNGILEYGPIVAYQAVTAPKVALQLFAGTPKQILINVSHETWTHIVFTCDRDGNGYGYKNGVPGTGVALAGVTSLSTSTDMFIAAKDGTFFAGQLDDIRFYKKVLSQQEVLAIYNEGNGTKATGTEDGLSWASNCDDGGGDNLTDIVSGVNGTLTNNVEDNMWEEGGVETVEEEVQVGFTSFDFEGWD